MGIKVGINGFGRIGRLVLRSVLENKTEGIDVLAVNDLTDAATLAHLLKYDSNFGILENEVKSEDNALVVDGKRIEVLSQKDPSQLPWSDLGVEVVVESTGIFRNAEKAGLHLKAGAKKVIISAPAKGGDVSTFVLGVNEEKYDPAKDSVVSNASCTTNCIAPVVKVVQDIFGVKKGLMTTIHSYTNDQKILDFPHKDLRRARAAAVSMIPTTTGAAKAVGLVIPELKGKLDGLAIRVPTPTVSIVDVVLHLQKEATAEEVNSALKDSADGKLKGILAVSKEPLVSVDFKKNPFSSIVDLEQTYCMGDMVKILSWYDNEWGYSCRLVDLIKYMMNN
ncbi:MAG: type I glyceraldehyde-3-phosphate dehydrogenase [Candidatus Omnitrophica bacterium]|nr:type I glyceraldehyde-3-phosphate dehydrogenase [Candidatus Omnitrophota bacterium]MBD3268711.1 type I glyceraldehyde-3-phosphate dehydrogenase [Candidatus Omnitrophota bacterium]